MLVDANTPSASATNVTGAIRQAAQATGTNFQYLLATAQVESGFNPAARAATSSAGGLFQFIEQTWLGTLKEAGPSLGYGRYADAITRTQSGRYVVSDPTALRAILALRQDPAANAMMAGAFTRSNAAKLKAVLGREPTGGELYMAHFLGAAGATRLLDAAARNAQARAADLFPNGARANRTIFYDKLGQARSVAQVAQALDHRYQVALGAPVAAPALAVAAAPAGSPAKTEAGERVALGLPPDPAALARAYEALTRAAQKAAAPPDTAPVVQALARSDRREPLAPVVVKVWSVHAAPVTVADAPPTQQFSAATPARPGNGSRFDLFEDFAPDVRPLFTGS
jgi:hypothetical protein